MRPLADRMRPGTLDHYVGQEHLVGPNGALRKSMESGHIPSFILWGPPGVGKTTLASIIANQLNRPFKVLSAVHSGVKDVRQAIDDASRQKFFDTPGPILFIDEIHRFSKSQQDSLLGAVEKGIVTLIGATTENPSFEVISALLSRCQVYILKPLEKDDLEQLVQFALQQDEYLKEQKIQVEEYDVLIQFSGGDARRLLNAVELVAQITGPKAKITNELVSQLIQENNLRYDKGGDQHYDMASAFIKSIRGSDPNAAVYWLARMIEGGEDEKFICRRMVISAAEDIGLANPNALLLANQCFQAVQAVGFPEARIIMSQTAIYLATSEKSNAAYDAIAQAQALVRKTGNQAVPLHLRNAPTQLMKTLDYGKDYAYAHAYAGNFVDQEYLPEALSGSTLYRPGKNTQEKRVLEKLKRYWSNKYDY